MPVVVTSEGHDQDSSGGNDSDRRRSDGGHGTRVGAESSRGDGELILRHAATRRRGVADESVRL